MRTLEAADHEPVWFRLYARYRRCISSRVNSAAGAGAGGGGITPLSAFQAGLAAPACVEPRWKAAADTGELAEAYLLEEVGADADNELERESESCLLYTSPSPRD